MYTCLKCDTDIDVNRAYHRASLCQSCEDNTITSD